jgi:hypothetical protein
MPPCELARDEEQERCRGSARSQPLRAEDPVDADGDQRAGDNGNRVEVGGLVERIEEGEEEQTGNAAGDRARSEFDDNESAAPLWTSVPICKVALAVGTSRHLMGISAGRAHESTARHGAEVGFPCVVRHDRRFGHIRSSSPSAVTASANRCATVSGPNTRVFTRTNSSAKRNAPTPTK